MQKAEAARVRQDEKARKKEETELIRRWLRAHPYDQAHMTLHDLAADTANKIEDLNERDKTFQHVLRSGVLAAIRAESVAPRRLRAWLTTDPDVQPIVPLATVGNVCVAFV